MAQMKDVWMMLKQDHLINVDELEMQSLLFEHLASRETETEVWLQNAGTVKSQFHSVSHLNASTGLLQSFSDCTLSC